MSDAIIGGAIAAVIGAGGYTVIGLLLECRREKAQRLVIVNALITETEENLTICETFLGQKMWWLASYRLGAYHAYKGQLPFLHTELRVKLVGAALIMETCNSIIQTVQLKEGSGQSVDKKAMPRQGKLIEQLEFVNKGLHKWKAEHSRNLAFRIRQRLRHFPRKIVEKRKNS